MPTESITIEDLVNWLCEEQGIELWKDVLGFEQFYQVSNVGGKIRNKRTGVVLKPGEMKNGYVKVTLCDGTKKQQRTVHRIVAEAWVPNTKNLPDINHIDEIKTSNNAANLEWCDAKYNSNYGTAKYRNSLKQGSPVRQYTMAGELIAEYPSTKSAAIQSGLNQARIYGCCAGLSGFKSTGGYIWKFA